MKHIMHNTTKLLILVTVTIVFAFSSTAYAAPESMKKSGGGKVLTKSNKSVVSKASESKKSAPKKAAPKKNTAQGSKKAPAKKAAAKAKDKPNTRPNVRKSENLRSTDGIPTSRVTNPGVFHSNAKQAFLLDYTTNTILYDKNGSELAGPASMTKVMTAYIVFDHVKNQKLKFSDKFCTSRYASTRGGTKMFLKENDCTDVQNLTYGLLTMSGNDAAATIAEGVSGSEPEFVKLMNEYAKKLGMNSTTFANPSGLPHPDHISTARDLTLLAKRALDDFPQYYPFFGRKVFEYNGIVQPNRNKLINENMGVDGFKTGFTNASGYGLIVSAERDGRRIIGVVNGNPTARKRLDEARNLVNYAYDEFEIVRLFDKEKTIDRMRVWGGNVDYVNLFSPNNIQFVVRKSTKATAQYRTEILFKEPWKAPLKGGTHAANLAVYENDKLRATYPLYTASDVGQGTFTESIVDKFKLLTNSDKQNTRKR